MTCYYIHIHIISPSISFWVHVAHFWKSIAWCDRLKHHRKLASEWHDGKYCCSH